jgi:RNA polymerase sigma-54 factor
MKQSLQLRLSQHLALTPQLQQSIRLLQLSTLELHQEVALMLEQNPFLEREDDDPDLSAAMTEPPADLSKEADDALGSYGDSDNDSAAANQDAALTLDQEAFGATDREDWENGTERDDFDGIAESPRELLDHASTGSAASDFEPQDASPHDTSLRAHLHSQLLSMRLSPEDALALEVVIEALNDDGYLDEPLDALISTLDSALGHPPESDEPETDELDIPAGPEDTPAPQHALLTRLQCALNWLQSLDPPGVGARSLSECLLLQLREHPTNATTELARHICAQHLDLLARRDLRKLMATTGADEDALRAAQKMITSLEPKPGRPFGASHAQVLVPDVVVQQAGSAWRTQLNPEAMPRLRIHETYAQALRGHRSDDSHAALSARLQEARWFVKNVLQRFDTILRVSQAIVDRQKNFLTHGEMAMRPLVLREIADELGLHESTISRVTTAKYMATPRGTFELKYFFGSSVQTESGGNASSTAVKALIKQLVMKEDTSAPLSDQQLTQQLEDHGIQVARRTVAKYREALKIAPASLRKSL